MAAGSPLSGRLPDLAFARYDGVAIAFDPALDPGEAGELASRIRACLDAVPVAPGQQDWLVAAAGDEEAAALVLAAVEPQARGARLALHDPHDPDALVFQRRIPGQRRGGVYLNAAWQLASIRIACGDPARVLRGLAAWFTPADVLEVERDLAADAVLARPKETDVTR